MSKRYKHPNEGKNVKDRFFGGGIGYGKICFPVAIPRILITILFPPLGVFLEQLQSRPRFPNINRIFINIVLTTFFYFPGLIHALNGFNCNM
tara:strand:+ start:105 stop:380 length:276 start_codon:yes stop_codon:yes gene_type:complete